MAPTSDQQNAASGIYGETELTVKIENLTDIARVAEDVLSKPHIHNRIRSILINAEEAVEEPDEDEDQRLDLSAQSEGNGAQTIESTVPSDTAGDGQSDNKSRQGPDERLARLCESVVQILQAVKSAGGSLKEFSWHQEDWWDSKGKRSQAFWHALWRHASTLEHLTLGFYTHEVREVSPAETHFPALKELYLDCSTAHGDDGSAIEHLLGSSPNLEVLSFEYPGCDLNTCQIRNITWDYTFSHLRMLSVDGYDFDPEAFTKFLIRHSSIEIFQDRMTRDSYDEDAHRALPYDALPNLIALKSTGLGPSRELQQWFNPSTTRKIKHLAVSTDLFEGFPTISQSQQQLKCLEFHGDPKDWRKEPPIPEDSDDSDDSEDEGVKQRRKKYIEEERRKKLNARINRRADTVEKVLPLLKELQELGVGMESENTSTWQSDGKGGGYWTAPNAMSEDDLRTVISILPADTGIRALRVWDKEAEDLPHACLEDLPNMPKSLEYLSWEGKEKILYQLKREGGKVRAEPCERLRISRENIRINWTQQRILDY